MGSGGWRHFNAIFAYLGNFDENVAVTGNSADKIS